MRVSTKANLEKELAEAEEARDGLQQLLDETEGWDDVDQDAIDEFVNQSPGRDDEPILYALDFQKDFLEQYALNRARLNVALLADALGGFPAGDYVLYPQGDRIERVRVMTLHGDAGDAVKAPDEAQHVVVVDDRAGGSEGIYYRHGGGEFHLSEAQSIADPGELSGLIGA